MNRITEPFKRNRVSGRLVAALLLAGATFISSGEAQTVSTTANPPRPPAVAPSPSVTPQAHSRYRPNPVSKRAGEYYPLLWGVDSMSVKAVESGELIRFTYRVVDPSKATVFNDKKVDAFLDAPTANARLVIPSLEKVGQLRQYNTPEPGKSYWMAFSNPRRTVKRGDYVNVVIGHFRVDGLVVQ